MTDLNVVFQDRDLLVIDKPSGLLSVPGKSIADSAETRARAHFPHVWAVHRLDRDTSGLLVLALRRSAERHLQDQFAKREVQKEYRAWVAGILPESGSIHLPLARLGGDPPRNVVDLENGLPAKTLFRRTQVRGLFSEVQLWPETGRSHQLRVHLLAIGHPIVGDPIYAPEHPAPRLLLHACKLRCRHPYTAQELNFESIPPFEGPAL